MILHAFSSLPGAPSMLPLISILLHVLVELKTSSTARGDEHGHVWSQMLASLFLALSYRLCLAAATFFHVRSPYACVWCLLSLLCLQEPSTHQKTSKMRRRSHTSWQFRCSLGLCQPSLAKTGLSTFCRDNGHRYACLFTLPRASSFLVYKSFPDLKNL